jgi:hypothetical protein
MNDHMFLQTTIAVIWDFDTTLIPGYMEVPLFQHFGVDAATFWGEVNNLPDFYRRGGADRVSKDTVYLNHILAYVRSGKFKDLSNGKLKELGRQIEFYDGLPEFFRKVRDYVTNNPIFSQHEIRVEHYIVSTGLKAMIEGSRIAPYVDGIWACEFAEASAGPGYLKNPQPNLFEGRRVISEIAYALDNTSKTRALFEINKGTNKYPQIDVNSTISEERRRIPFENMIYVADGPSDIPSFSVVKRFRGKTFAVYKPKSEAEFAKAYGLQKQQRVHAFGESDYRDGSQTSMWILRAAAEIAERIVRDRTRTLRDGLGQPPEHVIDRPQKGTAVVPSGATAVEPTAPKKSVVGTALEPAIPKDQVAPAADK